MIPECGWCGSEGPSLLVQIPGSFTRYALSRYPSLPAQLGYWGSLAVYCCSVFVSASAVLTAGAPFLGPRFMGGGHLRLSGPRNLRCVASFPFPCRCQSNGPSRFVVTCAVFVAVVSGQGPGRSTLTPDYLQINQRVQCTVGVRVTVLGGGGGGGPRPPPPPRPGPLRNCVEDAKKS